VLNIMPVLISHNNTEAVRFCTPTFITSAAGRPLQARVTTLLRCTEGWTVTKHTHDAFSYSSVAVIDGAVDCLR
jgi:hypothetical protein